MKISSQGLALLARLDQHALLDRGLPHELLPGPLGAGRAQLSPGARKGRGHGGGAAGAGGHAQLHLCGGEGAYGAVEEACPGAARGAGQEGVREPRRGMKLES